MIQINLIRISADSKYIELSVECPTGHTFNTLQINKYISNGIYDDVVDLSSQLDGSTNKEVIRIATSIFGSDVTMYKIELGVTQILETPTIDNVVGICSNVNFVYANLLDLILKLTNGCITQVDYDNMDRNHMILYAHQEAMRLHRIEDAEYFYDIIFKLFKNCGPSTRQPGIINTPCNC